MSSAGRALLETLLELAQLDSQIDLLQKQKQAVTKEISLAEDNLSKAQEGLEKAKAQKKDKAKLAYHIEHEMKQKEEELQKVRKRLLAAKTNEEFRLLKEQEQNLLDEISRMEDQALEALDEEDEVETEIEQWKRRVREAEVALKSCEQKAKNEFGRIEKDEAFLMEKRRRVVSTLPPHVLERYERVRRKVGGSPIAEADPLHQVCRGCQMQLTLQDIVEIRRGEQLVFCRYCNRILYIPEEQLT